MVGLEWQKQRQWEIVGFRAYFEGRATLLTISNNPEM